MITRDWKGDEGTEAGAWLMGRGCSWVGGLTCDDWHHSEVTDGEQLIVCLKIADGILNVPNTSD